MDETQDRRRAPRIHVAGRLGARARATLDVRLLDVSVTGVRIEHYDVLRPGSIYAFQFPPALGPLTLSTKVAHSTVIGAEKTPEGERLLRYQSGLTFIAITAEQQASLAGILERITPGGGLGNGRIIL
jgi:hypothetical protein